MSSADQECALQLLREDVTELGCTHDSSDPGLRAALQALTEELESVSLHQTLLKHEDLVRTDLDTALRLYLLEAEDRRIAYSLAEETPAPDPYEDAVRSLQQNTNSAPVEEEETCAGCLEEPARFTLGCGHAYCTACTQRLFEAAARDVSLHPVHCCSVDKGLFPEGCAEAVLRPGLLKQFVETEHHWRELQEADNPARLEDLQLDPAGRGSEWQQCPRCSSVVFINRGCNHMRCICGCDFCFVCAVVWHNCSCALWAERNIIYEVENARNNQQRQHLQALANENRECVHSWVRYQLPGR
eukprot:m51a1_g6989 hypothetical protein (300) ;mRNA; r:156269-157168